MFKKKNLILLVIVLITLIGITSMTIAAWLTDSDATDEVEFTIGQIQFAWTGQMAASPIVPGQNLISDTYKLTNSSNISTELRIYFVVLPQIDNFLLLNLMDGWVEDGDYWYYRGVDTTVEIDGDITKYKIMPELTEINVLESIVLNGNLVGNSYQNTSFTISVVFEAKQADYVTWETLGTANVDFSTGLPNV